LPVAVSLDKNLYFIIKINFMKKLPFIIMLFVLTTPAFNQESPQSLLNKQGVNILPERGEIAIAIDAVPFLGILTRDGTRPGFNFVQDIPAFGLKYFTSNTSAWRMNFRIGHISSKSSTNPEKSTSLGFGMGYEQRLGKSRVQGFYGIGGGVDYEYSRTYYGGLDYTGNSVVAIGAKGFFGVEVFIAAKLSIGGEFNWGPTFLDRKHGGHLFYLGHGNADGALMLNFYF
jgi:hypothetical protein